MITYVADFETSVEDGKAWVWAYGISALHKKGIKIGSNIKDFFRHIFIGKSKKIYFHNLKYDGKFILNYLLNNGYVMCEKAESDKQLSGLIDKQGTFYNIKVNYVYNGNLYYISFLDSFKIFSYSLATCAKQFGLTVTKGDMDYELIRYENHIMTESEKDYLIRDVEILREIMCYAEKEGLLNSITLASSVMKEYKDFLKSNNIIFSDIFPKLTMQEDEDLRKYYRGGYCWYNEKYLNKTMHTYVYDVNSEYPYILCNSYLPYGRPRYFRGKYKENKVYQRYVQHVRCEFIKNENNAAMVQLKRNLSFLSNEYISFSGGIVDLYFTDGELKLFLKTHTILSMEYVDGYMFQVSNKLFAPFLLPIYNTKANTDNKVLRFMSKIRLNSFYGKFGVKSKKEGIIYGIDDEDILYRIRDTINYIDTIYLPVSIFTTADARCYILSYINNNYGKFIYCDTDSIHLTEKATENDLPLDNKKLGYFKLEESGIAKYLKQKTYYIDLDKEYQHKDDNGKLITNKITCAGLNKKLIGNITIKDFCYNATFPKIRSVNVKGGVALCQSTHIITPPVIGVLRDLQND